MMPGDAVDHHQRVPAAGARQGDRHVGRRVARWRSRSGRSSAASSSSTSRGSRSSSSTSRSPSVAVAVTLFATHESRDETVARKVDVAGVVDDHRRPRRARARARRGQRLGLGLAARSSACSPSPSSALAAFVVIERRVRAPMVDFAFFRSRSFLGANIVAFIVSASRCSRCSSSSRSTCRTCAATSPLEAGVRFLPSTVVIIVIGPDRRPAGRPGRPAAADDARPRASSPRRCSWQSLPRADTSYALPRRRLRPDGHRHGPRHVADEHRRDERGRPDQGRRRLRRPVDEPHGRRHVRRRRDRRADRRRSAARDLEDSLPAASAGQIDHLVDALGAAAAPASPAPSRRAVQRRSSTR